MNARVDRLREKLEQPLLVSDGGERPLPARASPARTRHCSSTTNESRSSPTTATPRAPAAVEGAEFVEAKRDLYQTLSELLSGPIGFEATSLTFERYSTAPRGRGRAGPHVRARRGAPGRQGRGRAGAIRRAAAITDIAFERFADEGGLVGRTEKELAWRFETFLHEANADGRLVPALIASGPNAAKPHTVPGERRVERGETVIVDAGCVVNGYCSDCTRTFATGSLPDELAARLRGLPRRAARRARGGQARCLGARRRLCRARPDRGGRLRRGLRARPRPRRRPPRARGSAPRAGVRSTLAVGNVVTVEPGIYLSGLGGIRIEDLVVVQEDGPEILSPFRKDLITLD